MWYLWDTNSTRSPLSNACLATDLRSCVLDQKKGDAAKAPVGLGRDEGAALEVGARRREHEVHRDQRTGVVVARVPEAAAGLVLVVPAIDGAVERAKRMKNALGRAEVDVRRLVQLPPALPAVDGDGRGEQPAPQPAEPLAELVVRVQIRRRPGAHEDVLPACARRRRTRETRARGGSTGREHAPADRSIVAHFRPRTTSRTSSHSRAERNPGIRATAVRCASVGSKSPSLRQDSSSCARRSSCGAAATYQSAALAAPAPATRRAAKCISYALIARAHAHTLCGKIKLKASCD